MRLGERVADRAQEVERGGGGEGAAGDAAVEGLAFEELADEVELPVGAAAEVDQLEGVGVAQPRDHARLALEAADLPRVAVGVGPEELDRDVALDGELPRPVDGAHAARADAFDDAIAAVEHGAEQGVDDVEVGHRRSRVRAARG
ncbi:MAG: hypothetical protein R3F65_04585 [bacterium]